LDPKGNAKIGDFGLSCKLAPNDRLKMDFTGDNIYFAPEMLSGPRTYNHLSDHWCLGINVFILLTGRSPFHTNEQVINNPLPDLNEARHKAGDPEDISEAGYDFVKKILAKNPHERLGSQKNLQNIKEHPFFESIDWVRLENGEIAPPYRPDVVIYLFFSGF
jgi:serine/threonine protein kinase